MTRTLTLVQPDPVEDITRRRAQARAMTIARIGGIRPHDDIKRYPGGHVWVRRRDHETLVLLVKERLER